LLNLAKLLYTWNILLFVTVAVTVAAAVAIAEVQTPFIVQSVGEQDVYSR
jgi:hypothetical protein